MKKCNRRGEMKLTTSDDLASGAIKIMIEFTEGELDYRIPTRFETECRKLCEKTNRASDKLMYLSEVVKNIEDSQLEREE